MTNPSESFFADKTREQLIKELLDANRTIAEFNRNEQKYRAALLTIAFDCTLSHTAGNPMQWPFMVAYQGLGGISKNGAWVDINRLHQEWEQKARPASTLTEDKPITPASVPEPICYKCGHPFHDLHIRSPSGLSYDKSHYDCNAARDREIALLRAAVKKLGV
jgi:hypothetical protein